jgi:hypothetical protein
MRILLHVLSRIHLNGNVITAIINLMNAVSVLSDSPHPAFLLLLHAPDRKQPKRKNTPLDRIRNSNVMSILQPSTSQYSQITLSPRRILSVYERQ